MLGRAERNAPVGIWAAAAARLMAVLTRGALSRARADLGNLAATETAFDTVARSFHASNATAAGGEVAVRGVRTRRGATAVGEAVLIRAATVRGALGVAAEALAPSRDACGPRDAVAIRATKCYGNARAPTGFEAAHTCARPALADATTPAVGIGTTAALGDATLAALFLAAPAPLFAPPFLGAGQLRFGPGREAGEGKLVQEQPAGG